jgi:hypothetical protein
MLSKLMAAEAMRAEKKCRLRENASLNKLAAMAPLVTDPLQR